jgi:hypothetical protein
LRDAPAASLTPAQGADVGRGGGVSPPSWHHPEDRDADLKKPDAPVTVAGLNAVPTRGADKKRAARARKIAVLDGSRPGTTRLLARRVDALAIAYRVELSTAFTDELCERQALAELGGCAELTLPGGIALALGRSRRQDFFSFQNADVRGALDLRASGRWRCCVPRSSPHTP